ncbi:hypothetical protein [uncultured Luteimonas sp.]|uniref:hypothetical protein n=1 Tax=uncultured Luteimonas sp. TaxID=453144 RepID=UPI0026032EF0|nr:hypothetical protein [uncultured Luteimonas sp.]
MAQCNFCDTYTSSDVCPSCRAARGLPQESVVREQAVAPFRQVDDPTSQEGETAKLIGTVILWLSVIAGIMTAFFFGRVTVPKGPYSTEEVWNSTIVIFCIAAGLNGAFFGYLLSKVGSVLIRLQKLTA